MKTSILTFLVALTAACAVSTAISTTSFAIGAPAIVKEAGMARLKLASVLIKALDHNQVCDTDAYPSEIIRLVSSASALVSQAELAKWAKTIPATSKIKADLAFRQILKPAPMEGQNIEIDKVTELLIGAKFFRLGAGAYGSTSNVTLKDHGVATRMDLELLEVEPYTKWNETTEQWSAIVVPSSSVGSKVRLEIGGEMFDIELHENEYWLVPVKFTDEFDKQHNTYSSSDSYCEA